MDWYEYPSNYSNGTSVDSFGSYIQYISYITNDWLATGFLVIIWLAMFVFGIVSGTKKAIALASFVTFMLSVYLVRLNLVNIVIPITLLILTAISVILSGSEEGSL